MSGKRKLPRIPSSLLTLLCILLVLFVLGSRWMNGAPLTPLDESYSHMAAARAISAGAHEGLFASNAGLYDYLLALMPIDWLLPPLLGLFSLFLLSRLFEKKFRSYAVLLFIITPLALALFTTHTPAALFLPLSLLAFMAYQKGWFYDFGVILLAVLLLLVDPIAGALVLLVFSLYALHEGRGRVAGFLILLEVCFILLCFFVGYEPSFTAPSMFFGELGDPHGYSLFITLLALLSFLRQWNKTDMGEVVLIILLFGVSSVLPTLRPLVLIPLVLAAARGLVDLAQKDWALPLLKQATTILLLCLGLFVVLSHSQLLIQAEPSPAIVEIAEKLRLENRPGSVLVSPDVAGSIAYFSGRDVISFPFDDPLFSAVRINLVAPTLIEQAVRYVVITPTLEQEAWGRADRGFRFLMLRNEKFINVLSVDGYELWLVLPEFAR